MKGKQKIIKFLVTSGKLLLDIAKLLFGSLVLGTVIRGDLEHAVLLTAGIIASAVTASTGLLIISLLED